MVGVVLWANYFERQKIKWTGILDSRSMIIILKRNSTTRNQTGFIWEGKKCIMKCTSVAANMASITLVCKPTNQSSIQQDFSLSWAKVLMGFFWPKIYRGDTCQRLQVFLFFLLFDWIWKYLQCSTKHVAMECHSRIIRLMRPLNYHHFTTGTVCTDKKYSSNKVGHNFKWPNK